MRGIARALDASERVAEDRCVVDGVTTIVLVPKGRGPEVAGELGGVDWSVLVAEVARTRSEGCALLTQTTPVEPWDPAWHLAHHDRVVHRTSLLARTPLSEEVLSERAAIIDREGSGGSSRRAEWARLHRFVLAVEVTAPHFLSHLVEGLEYGTTGIDWVDDPDAVVSETWREWLATEEL